MKILKISVVALVLLPALAFAQVSGSNSGFPQAGETSTFPPPGNTSTFPPPNSSNFSQSPTSNFCPPNSFCLGNPISASGFCSLLNTFLKSIWIPFIIPLAVVAIVYAGLLFVLARGNSEKLNEAKRALVNVLIGVGLVLIATTLMQVLVYTIQQIGVSPGGAC